MAEAATTRTEAAKTAPGPAKGTRPEGATTEADASRKVREMFTQIAPRYDLLNHLLSAQLDRVWRERTARVLRPILERSDATALDLCCGTGDLALALAKAARARVIGADFAHAMLVRARDKAEAQRKADAIYRALTAQEEGCTGTACRAPTTEGETSLEPQAEGISAMEFFEADALRLPFRDASFDLVTSAFGFRNLVNYEAGLREMQRVLKPGGTIAILEFTEPPDGALGNLYRWYFRGVLPKIGALISGNSAAYSYLPKSVSRFFQPHELASLMSAVGYEDVEFRSWTFRTVALHTARRKKW